MTDVVREFTGSPLGLIGVHESVSRAREALSSVDALLVTDDGKTVTIKIKEGVKYSPHIAAIVREVRGPASEYAKATMEATRQKRLALTKARSVRDGRCPCPA